MCVGVAVGVGIGAVCGLGDDASAVDFVQFDKVLVDPFTDERVLVAAILVGRRRHGSSRRGRHPTHSPNTPHRE
jgi:hypothetical protein